MLLKILNDSFNDDILDLNSLFDTNPDLFIHIINNGNILYSRFLAFFYEQKKLIKIPQFILLQKFPRKKDINKFVCIEGTVIKTNPIMITDVDHKLFCFRCNVYSEELKIFNKNPKKKTKSNACSVCGDPMKLKRNFERAVQTQSIKIQDISMGLSEICEIRLPSFLVGKVKPGQRVGFFGVVLIEEKKDENLFARIFVDALAILEKKSEVAGEKIEEVGFERQKLFLKKFCEEIYGYDCVKLGLMLSIFGITNSTLNRVDPIKRDYEIINDEDLDISFSDSEICALQVSDELSFDSIDICEDAKGSEVFKDNSETKSFDIKNSHENKRRNSHVLIIGASASGKSRLLKSSSCISKMELSSNVTNKRSSVFINGLNTTEAGLTTCAIRSGKDWVLEAGALVLADGGTCFIDGFEHLNLSDKSGLLEVMEQQTLSIAKAGLVTTLTTRCSVVASSSLNNIYDFPHLSIEYQKHEYIENKDQNELITYLKISPPLFSRFDLIFILPDEINKGAIDHILNYDYKKTQETENIFNNVEYNGTPELCEEGINYLTAYYTLLVEDLNGIRNLNRCVSTIRLLEGLIRLLIGHCHLMGTRHTDFNTFTIIFLMEMSVRGTRGILKISPDVFTDELVFNEEVKKMKEILNPIIKLL
ncbi:putative DNA helicase MCM9 [Cucumispora dikerogammari]|nr:putative DNA helicase MCM9 [Cucumispora dikerogammari]